MTDAVTRSRLTGDRCPQIEATAPAEEQQRSTVPVWLQGVVLLVHLLPLGLAAGTLVEDAEVVHSLPLVLLALTTLLGLTAGIHQLILRPLCQEAEAREQAQPIGQSRWEEARAATAGVGFTTAFAVAGSAVAVVAIFPLLLGESSTYPLPFLGIGVLSVLPRLTAASQCGAPLPSWSLLVLGATFINLLDEMLAPPARLTAKTNAELEYFLGDAHTCALAVGTTFGFGLFHGTQPLAFRSRVRIALAIAAVLLCSAVTTFVRIGEARRPSPRHGAMPAASLPSLLLPQARAFASCAMVLGSFVLGFAAAEVRNRRLQRLAVAPG